MEDRERHFADMMAAVLDQIDRGVLPSMPVESDDPRVRIEAIGASEMTVEQAAHVRRLATEFAAEARAARADGSQHN